MLLFYGWKHPDDPEGKAFLLIDKKLLSSTISENNEVDDKLSVFPNPANHTLSVRVVGSDINKIMINNLTGQTLYNETSTSNPSRINIAHLSSGIYLLKAENAYGVNTVKFIKAN